VLVLGMGWDDAGIGNNQGNGDTGSRQTIGHHCIGTMSMCGETLTIPSGSLCHNLGAISQVVSSNYETVV